MNVTVPRTLSSSAGPTTAEGIADRAQQFKVVVLAQQLTLITLVDESQTMLRFHQQLTGAGPDGDIPVVLTGGSGHDQLVAARRPTPPTGFTGLCLPKTSSAQVTEGPPRPIHG